MKKRYICRLTIESPTIMTTKTFKHMDDIIIRSMQCNEIEKVMQIWLRTNIHAHHFIEESYWKSQYDNVKAMIPDSEIYICEKAQQTVGFIGLSGNYIAGLFVDPEFQCQGVGKELLEHVKSIKPELSLNVYQKNQKAVRFYLREGFTTETESVDENTGEKEFLMKRIKNNPFQNIRRF